MITRIRLTRGGLYGTALLAVLALSACVEHSITAPAASVTADPDAASGDALAAMDCVGDVVRKTVSCAAPKASSSRINRTDLTIGGNHTYVNVVASNATFGTNTQFDVTIQNLMNEAIGTPDGFVADTGGIKIFFSNLSVTGTSDAQPGTISVANADGTGTFTAANQPFFRYNQILAKNAVSSAKTWQMTLSPNVTSFAMSVYVHTAVQQMLVINELLANPGGTISDANGEWVELYNAGTLKVKLNGLVFADSAASGRRPYNLFNTTDIIPPGGYYVIGNTKNTTNNGGVPVDYAYGAGMAFANSLDAFKIALVYGTDTLTIDRTQYASAAISAQNGISRELKNPALDNSNMDGSNWGDASVTSVYGPGGRGTPKAQNSAFAP